LSSSRSIIAKIRNRFAGADLGAATAELDTVIWSHYRRVKIAHLEDAVLAEVQTIATTGANVFIHYGIPILGHFKPPVKIFLGCTNLFKVI
jgi:hypothetical protein